jgi:hypothetical protein
MAVTTMQIIVVKRLEDSSTNVLSHWCGWNHCARLTKYFMEAVRVLSVQVAISRLRRDGLIFEASLVRKETLTWPLFPNS